MSKIASFPQPIHSRISFMTQHKPNALSSATQQCDIGKKGTEGKEKKKAPASERPVKDEKRKVNVWTGYTLSLKPNAIRDFCNISAASANKVSLVRSSSTCR